MNELLPCPHCDSGAEMTTEHGRDSSMVSVHCSACGNTGFSYEWLGDQVEAEAKVVARWNRRAASPPAPQLVEKREPECACGHPYACGAAERAARQPAQPSEVEVAKVIEGLQHILDDWFKAPNVRSPHDVTRCMVRCGDIQDAIRLLRSQPKPGLSSDVDALAQIIREVDGNHDLGAGALAEAILRKLAKWET